MLAAVMLAQTPTDGATGARLGRWIDDHFAVTITVACVATMLVVVTILLLLKGYRRQRRLNRRLRRHQELTLQRRIDTLHEKVDELRGDVRQLAELEDHVVAQVKILRSTVTGAGAASASSPWSMPSSSSPLSASNLRPAPIPEPASMPVAAKTGQAPAPASSDGSADVRDPAPPRSSGAPAVLVETGEPLVWATRPQQN